MRRGPAPGRTCSAPRSSARSCLGSQSWCLRYNGDNDDQHNKVDQTVWQGRVQSGLQLRFQTRQLGRATRSCWCWGAWLILSAGVHCCCCQAAITQQGQPHSGWGWCRCSCVQQSRLIQLRLQPGDENSSQRCCSFVTTALATMHHHHSNMAQAVGTSTSACLLAQTCKCCVQVPLVCQCAV